MRVSREMNAAMFGVAVFIGAIALINVVRASRSVESAKAALDAAQANVDAQQRRVDAWEATKAANQESKAAIAEWERALAAEKAGAERYAKVLKDAEAQLARMQAERAAAKK